MEVEQQISDILGNNEGNVTTRTSIIGRTRTFAGLDCIEWTFLVISTINLLACAALTIYRLVKVVREDPSSPDFTFTIIILVNTVFCGIYIIHGLLREKEFEIYAYCGAVFIILCYCVGEYIVNGDKRTSIKLARLILISLLGPVNIIIGFYVAKQFGWLEFKIVGASQEFQFMYREASRYTSLLKFDLQLSVTFIILVLTDGTNATKLDIYIIACGLPLILVITVVGWISLRIETKVGVLTFALLSLMQPAFVIYKIIWVYTQKDNADIKVLVISMLFTGALCLLIHTLLYYELYHITRNFGKGLKERAFQVDERTSLLAVTRRR